MSKIRPIPRQKYRFEIFINDELRFQVAFNDGTRTFENANGYIGYITGKPYIEESRLGQPNWGCDIATGQYKNFGFISPLD